MIKKKKNSIVARQLSQQTQQFVSKSIVTTSQAHNTLQRLLKHLKATIAHSYVKDVEINHYWLEIQLPLLLPYLVEQLKFSVSFKVFVIKMDNKNKLLLVEQFLEDGFDIDLTVNYEYHSNNLIKLFLNDSLCIGIIFDNATEYQDALETLIMKCYEVIFDDEYNTEAKTHLIT